MISRSLKNNRNGGTMEQEPLVPWVFMRLLLLSVVQSSMATSLGNSSLAGNLNDYIARTLPQLCPYEPLCYQDANETETDTRRSCCQPCSCQNHCQLLGNCCPDKVFTTETSTNMTTLSAEKFTCTKTYIGKRKKRMYYMISKCPEEEGQATDDLRLQCESSSIPSLSTLTPVIDPETAVVYRNTYCSQCHGVEAAVQWSNSFHCNFALLQTTNYGEVDSVNSLFENTCEVNFSPPHYIDVEPDRCFDDIRFVTCSLTGTWRPEAPSDMTQEACEMWRVPFDRFRNIYCSICNGIDLPYSCRPELDERIIGTSFTAILKHDAAVEEDDAEQTERSDQCPAGSVMDTHTDSCRRIVCPQFKHLVNGLCENILTNFDNIKLLMVLKIATDNVHFFSHEFDNWKLEVARAYLRFLVNDRSDLKVSLLNVAETAVNVTDQAYLTVLATVHVQSVPDPDILGWIYNRLKKSFISTTSDGKVFKFRVSINARIHIQFMNYERFEFDYWRGLTLTDLAVNSTLVNLFHHQYEDTDDSFILFSRLLFCQQVRLNQSEYEDFGMSIVVLASSTTLYTFDFMKRRATQDVRVCLEDYLGQPLALNDDQDSLLLRPGIIYTLVVAIAFFLGACVLAVMIYRHRRPIQIPTSSSGKSE